MIHHVFACKTNIGDWLSARAIQSLLQPQEVREYLCDEPFVARTIKRLAAVPREDFIVIGGGGLFMDYFMPFWEAFAGLADSKRFGIWGVGYCDEKRKSSLPSAGLLRDIISRSAFCSVRDRLTIDHLRLERALPIPCPSMALVQPPAAPGLGLLHVIHYDAVGDEAYEFVHGQAAVFARETGRPYRQIDNQIDNATERALDKALAAYAATDLIVTSRLHGCILGLAMGKKVLAVAGDRKIDSFMELAGLEDWVCAPSDRDRFVGRLRMLPAQAFPAEFVAGARLENLRMGETVRAMAATRSHSALA